MTASAQLGPAAESGAESSGEGWKVYAHREKGTFVCFMLAVNVAPNVRRKLRIPAKYDTPDLRRRFAQEAAPEMRKKYAEKQAAALVAVEDQARAQVATKAHKLTFGELAKLWTSGQLAKQYPDNVRLKRSAGDDNSRIAALLPEIGHIAVEDFTLGDAQRAMRTLPATVKTSATRRHYAQVMHRLLKLACFPLCLIPSNPLPPGFLPTVTSSKAKSYLYPAEDALLMASGAPLGRRMLWGVLAREGMREGEALALRWADVDLVRGVLTLDENKTDDPRAWALDPGVKRALTAWKKLRTDATDRAFVFVEESGGVFNADGLADRLRRDLQAAGVTRPELFKASESRLAFRVHDLRATFVTLALANGKSEAWVQDRTGHKSSQMVNKYRRVARMASELGLGTLAPLDFALPEFAEDTDRNGSVPVSESVSAPVSRQVTETGASNESPVFQGVQSVGPVGLEPTTYGLKVRSSTD